MFEIILTISSIVLGFMLSQLSVFYSERRNEKRRLESLLLEYRQASFYHYDEIRNLTITSSNLVNIMNANSRIYFYVELFKLRFSKADRKKLDELQTELVKMVNLAKSDLEFADKFELRYFMDVDEIKKKFTEYCNFLQNRVLKQLRK